MIDDEWLMHDLWLPDLPPSPWHQIAVVFSALNRAGRALQIAEIAAGGAE